MTGRLDAAAAALRGADLHRRHGRVRDLIGLIIEAVRGALRGIVERERVTVLVHPEDLEMVRAAMESMKVTLGGIEHCEVQAERRVSRGGAIVRTADGDVDARMETKLQRAREVVEAALGTASS